MEYLDFAFICYCLLFAGFVWLFVLFHYWHRQQKAEVDEFNKIAEASNLKRRAFSVGIVFHCMMWLSLGGFILSAVNAFSRWLKIIDSGYRPIFFDSILWHIRCVPLIIALYILCIQMTRRYLGGIHTK